jgi:uncharacterized damage-inducible protein DinB
MPTLTSPIIETMLVDFDAEIASTRRLLERIPENDPAWKPHEKSMPIGRLALHVARLPDFWHRIITTPELDLSKTKFPDLVFQSRQHLLSELERSSREAKQATEAASEEDLRKTWKCSWQGKTIVDAPRLMLYRTMFLNHMVHHRGQLTVYLRLLNIPIPGLYGPSADEAFG